MKHTKHHKLLIPLVLVVIIASQLWFAAPTRALDITLPSLPASGTTGTTYRFTVEVDIADAELLPIESIDLYIYKADDRAGYEAICADLPLSSSSKSYTSSETGGGIVNVTAATNVNWGYNYGYGNVSWQGTGYSFFPPGGYGYGFGPSGPGHAYLTYTVAWSVPSAWPVGNYEIEIKLNAGGDAFAKTSNTISLRAAVAGGGGGGGGAIGYTIVADYMGANGVFMADTQAQSPDGMARLLFLAGSRFLTELGYPGTVVRMVRVPVEEQPESPIDGYIIGHVYDLDPDNATFDPPIILMLLYDPSNVNDGILESDLVIAYWDAPTSKWIVLEDSEVDTVNHTVTAYVGHFTEFAVIGYEQPVPTETPTLPMPATFSVTSLLITPTEVEAGEEVTVSAVVTNRGDLPGSYVVTLEVDNQVVSTKEVTLEAKASTTVDFTTSGNVAKTYRVNVKGLIGTFAVKEPATVPTLAPAEFTVSGLSVNPEPAYAGEETTIGVQVTNTGDLSGTYRVNLKVDDVIVATRDVTIDGKTTQRETFTLSNTAGVHSVDVNGLSGTFTVLESPQPAVPPNWWLIGGIAGAALAIVTGITVAVKRNRDRWIVK